MIIKSIETQEKIYDCYDFTLLGGIVLPVNLNLEAGDTILVGPAQILITLQAKPSLTDPTILLPAEDVVIERRNLLAYQHRVMKVEEQTAEQHKEWKDTLLQIAKTVN